MVGPDTTGTIGGKCLNLEGEAPCNLRGEKPEGKLEDEEPFRALTISSAKSAWPEPIRL